MLSAVAAELAPALAGKVVAPDWDVQHGPCDLVSALNLLCQRRAWYLPQ
jgi:hypothetical protein